MSCQFCKTLEARLVEVSAALDAAGCPVGNEHKTYDVIERIAGLHKTRDYAWRQMDECRAELEELRSFKAGALKLTTAASVEHVK